jgi:hypothetical protein
MVTQQSLQAVQRHTGFELMGGEGMAQRVDAAAFANPRLAFGARVHPLYDADRQRSGGVGGAGEQPGTGPVDLVVRTQAIEQRWSQQTVAILGAFALLDAQRHPLAVQVGDPQVDDLTDAQPRGVGRLQQRLVLQVGNRCKQTIEFRSIEDLGQLLRTLRSR